MPTTVVPIIDPNRAFKVWSISEIYDESEDTNKCYVPNVGDLVYSPEDGLLRVENVDYTTGLSTFVKINASPVVGVTDEDVLLGAGPGTISESYRIFIDTSVIPHTLSFDARLKVYGSTVRSVKVLEGALLENKETISRFYGTQGELLGDSIPLEKVSNDESIWTPVVGHSAKALPDGTLVTAVFYDDVGSVVSKASLLVVNTSWIRGSDIGIKYITGIEIDSPFLSDADNHLIECPINVPVENIVSRGIVHYSNGEKKILPIDGTKFHLFGLRKFISTILGQKQPVTLVYYLSQNEVSYSSVPGDTKHMVAHYLATTTKVDGAYSVKLFSYPVWIDAVSGYRLEHFLYNLDRDEVFNVTQLVTIAANSRAFDPQAYGINQNLVFSIDLSLVSSKFRKYIHLQKTSITLRSQGLENNTNWTVTYDSTKDAYGDGIKAELEFVNANLWYLTLDNDLPTLESWLLKVYENTLPLYDATQEVRPPLPNFFRMIIGSTTSEHPITQWNHQFTLNRPVNPGGNIYLQFFKRTVDTDLELGTSALIIRQVN